MSRVNKFQEGHGPPKESWSIPLKKRKNRKKGFRLGKQLSIIKSNRKDS